MKLVSYNIQFGRGKDERFDLERIAKEVKGADIIAMQEVERFGRRSGMVDQVAELVRLLPRYHWVYGRAPILSARNHLLPKIDLVHQPSLQRAALEGVINCPNGPIRMYSLHLTHKSSLERERQVARLLQIHRQASGEGGV